MKGIVYFFHIFATSLTQINHYTSRTYIIYIINEELIICEKSLHYTRRSKKAESKTKGLKQKLKAE